MSSWCIFCVTDLRVWVDNLSSNYLHPPQSAITGGHRTLPEECRKGRYVGWREAAEKDPQGFLMQMMYGCGEEPKGIEEPWLEGSSVFHLLLP